MTPHQPCDEWAEILSAYADDEADAAEVQRVRAHLESCETCSDWLEAVRSDRDTYTQAFAERPRGDVWVTAAVDRLPEQRESEAASRRHGFRVIEALGLAAICAVLLAVVFPVFSRTRAKARQSSCGSNLKQLVLAISMYADDYGDRLPTSDRWRGAILPDYIESEEFFRCPEDDREHACGYAMSRSFSGVRLKDIPDPGSAPLLWDADQSGAWAPRHNDGGYVGFLDGHVKLMSKPPEGVNSGGSLGKVDRNYGLAQRLHMAYDASVGVQTRDVLEAVHSAERIVREQQGFVLESTFSESGQRPSASLTFKVPTGQLEVTLLALARLGKMVARSVQGQDMTQAVVSVETTLRREGDKQQRIGEELREQRKPAERGPLQREIVKSEEETLAKRRELYGVRSETVLATVSATLESPPDARPGSGAVIAAAFGKAGGVSARVGGVAVAWIAGLAPVWLPVLGIAWVIRRWRRRRAMA